MIESKNIALRQSVTLAHLLARSGTGIRPTKNS
jgi:hypothetical protein